MARGLEQIGFVRYWQVEDVLPAHSVSGDTRKQQESPPVRLIGMPDSPYVRRIAISLHLMRLPFEHEKLSVFRDFDRFVAINPVVKAPTLVLPDGTVLFESGLILELLERIAPPGHSLLPTAADSFLQGQRLIALALAVCEKSVQIAYELNLRPADKQHQPWLDRIERQLLAALAPLEAAFQDADGWLSGDRPLQADITTATAWRFARSVTPALAAEDRFPALSTLSRHAEASPAFLAVPFD